MNLQEARDQAAAEFNGQIESRAREIFAGQVNDMENTLASKRSEVETMQARLDSLRAEIASESQAQG
jgi:hypothetical protein